MSEPLHDAASAATAVHAHAHPVVHFAHELGHLEGRFAALERKVDGFEHRVECRLSSIETKLDGLGAALNFGRGGWKAVAVMGAIVAASLTFLRQAL